MSEEFNLREAQLRNELWLIVDSYSDLHGPTMTRIFQEFADHSKTSLDDLPGEDFEEGRVTQDSEVSTLDDKFRVQHDN